MPSSRDVVMSDQIKPASRLWRRFLRVSVRGLIVLILVFGAGLGWIVHTARLQRDAVAAIERAHGNVAYAAPFGVERFTHGLESRWVKWVASAIGVDTFCRVWSVRFTGRPSDAEMSLPGQYSGHRCGVDAPEGPDQPSRMLRASHKSHRCGREGAEASSAET